MGKSIFAKIRKRIIILLQRLIRYNYSYKPTGIYPSSKDYFNSKNNSDAGYIEVYADLISTLTISEELYKVCSAYLKPLLVVKTTYIVVSIPNGRIHTDNAVSVAVITNGNKLIGDVSFNYKNSSIVAPQENNIFKQTYFTKPLEVKGNVFSLLTGGSGINNYFHWLVDTLPRIHLLKQSGLFDKIDRFLVPSYRLPYQKDTLRLLGISEDKIIEAERYPHIEAQRLITSTAPRGNYAIIPNWVCQFLHEAFLKNRNFLDMNNSFIYISRKDSPIRHVLNEEPLIRLLNTYGFKAFVLNELSFEEQVQLFASAKIIVAPHGAGLINLAFCNKEAKVLEMFASGYVKATYHDLARKVGIEYHYLICESIEKPTYAKKGMKLDMEVDLQILTNMLDTSLAMKLQSSQLPKTIAI